MNRIRVGLIGLSTTSDSTSWASRAHLPYLLSEVGKKHYEIVALCNTSIEKGKKSIEQYNLPSSTKTYDSVTKLAADKDIDLIVNVTGVQQHYPLLKPAIEAGKDVFTELPLASDMGKCYELAQLAKEKGVKTVFGMQGQTSPVVMTIKRLIDEGKIGRVLSSTWTGAAVFMGERPIPKNHSAFLDRATGANLSTIGFLHSKSSHTPSSPRHNLRSNLPQSQTSAQIFQPCDSPPPQQSITSSPPSAKSKPSSPSWPASARPSADSTQPPSK